MEGAAPVSSWKTVPGSQVRLTLYLSACHQRQTKVVNGGNQRQVSYPRVLSLPYTPSISPNRRRFNHFNADEVKMEGTNPLCSLHSISSLFRGKIWENKKVMVFFKFILNISLTFSPSLPTTTTCTTLHCKIDLPYTHSTCNSCYTWLPYIQLPYTNGFP